MLMTGLQIITPDAGNMHFPDWMQCEKLDDGQYPKLWICLLLTGQHQKMFRLLIFTYIPGTV